jgi:hypothetical protein
VTRFVVDCETLLRVATGEIDVAAGAGINSLKVHFLGDKVLQQQT